MIDNRTKSIPTSSSEVGIYYVYISQGNKNNGVYIVSDFVLPKTITKIAELYNGDNTKENVIDIGTTNQYFRGDKTWQILNKTVVELPNVDDTADINKSVLSATKLTIPRTINNVSFDGSENIVINAVDSTPRIATSLMGVVNGVATLDSNGIIPITQLPSYIDDVIEVANYGSLPIIGESGKIYVTIDNNKTYRWSGSVYVYITSGAVDSVNGYTGVVVLTKSDFILGNVDNTSDVNKPISIATQSALDLKQNTLSLGNFTSTTPGITISNGNGSVIGSGVTFNITTAGTTTGGLITSGHWNTFNNKWDSSNHPITTLGYGLPDYPTTLPASDVYSWAKQITKPTYSYSEITSKPTLLSQFTNDLDNYGGWITGITSGMVTTALGYTPLPTRTFGTAAGSSVEDFIQNQNSSAQSANMWIDGNGKFVNIFSNYVTINNRGNSEWEIGTDAVANGIYIYQSGIGYRLKIDKLSGVATFSSTVNSTGFLLNGNNLTSNLTTNYIPKWNGSNFVNSLFSDNGSVITLTGGLRVGNSYAIPTSGNLNVEAAIRIGSTADYLYISNNTINPAGGILTIGGNVTATRFNGSAAGLTSFPTLNQNTTGSAATLTTSRTIWGQSFNGSGNITGAISGATTGTFSGDITANNYIGKSNGFYTVQITQAAYTALGTKDASTIYMIVG